MYKITALTLLQKYKLPIYHYEILKSDIFAEQIQNFIKRHNLKVFLIRTDSKDFFTPGLINANLSSATLEQIKKYFEDGYEVFIMESTPERIHRNSHSVNIAFYNDELVIEAVGNGFLATDLNRGGLLHEELVLSLPAFTIMHHRTFDKSYEKDRMKKIAVHEQEVRKNRGFLLENKKYQPLSKIEIDYIKKIFPKFRKISQELNEGKSSNFIASMSFIDLLGDGKIKPIIWDIYKLK